MWYNNQLSKLLNITYPIIQGPFGGGLSSARLAAAVSEAGGLGSFGAQPFHPDEIREHIRQIRRLTHKPFAINLWVSDRDEAAGSYGPAAFEKLKALFRPYFEELGLELPPMPQLPATSFEQQAEVILSEKPAVFSFVYGIAPAAILQECRRYGIVTIGCATTVDEALALQEAGVDAVVASGFEAGGHRVSFLRPAEESLTGTFALIPQVADRLQVPLIAAGGIADGRGVAAALTLGAQGVQVGTAFLACQESNAGDIHRQQLFSPQARFTTLSRAFTGRLARGISSRIAHETKGHEQDLAPFPLQGNFLAPLRAAATRQKRSELFSFWAGQSAALLKHHHAAILLHSLVAETERIMSGRAL